MEWPSCVRLGKESIKMQGQPSDIAIFLVAAAIAPLLRCLLQSVKRQREVAPDLKQAQEVQ
jgi:hypothetical protein